MPAAPKEPLNPEQDDARPRRPGQGYPCAPGWERHAVVWINPNPAIALDVVEPNEDWVPIMIEGDCSERCNPPGQEVTLTLLPPPPEYPTLVAEGGRSTAMYAKIIRHQKRLISQPGIFIPTYPYLVYDAGDEKLENLFRLELHMGEVRRTHARNINFEEEP